MRLDKALAQIKDEDTIEPTLDEVTKLRELLYACRLLFPNNFNDLHEIVSKRIQELSGDVGKRRALIRRLQG